MISRAEFAEWVGEENLQTVRPSALDRLSLPGSSVQFLCDVGLPRKGPFQLVFDFDRDRLPSLAEYGVSPALPEPRWARLARIGTDYGTQLCLDETQRGRLVSVDIEGDLPERFVNSSIEQFAACLLVHYKNSEVWPDTGGEAAKRLVAKAENEVRAIDPTHLPPWNTGAR